MVNSILIAVDETPAAKAAVAWAQQLVAHKRDSGQEVVATLLNVIDGRTHEGVNCFGYARNHEELRAEKLLSDLLADTDGAGIDTLVRAGTVADSILNEAQQMSADLIVLGTRHEGTIRQAIMGSVSQTVASSRERPVAVVPAESIIGTDLAVVGFDGSPGSRAALRWALANCDGDIRVVRAVGNEEEMIDAHESLAAMLPALGHGAEGRVRFEAVVGDPVSILTSPDRDTAQVILGARAESQEKDGLWGSTTTNVLADTERPVVVIPPGMWD